MNFWFEIKKILLDEEDPEIPVYDPVHIAIVIISVISVCSFLFWLLWSLLVYQGGIFSKVIPFFQVLLRRKTLADYGWVGYPFEMGVFNGWITNLVAAVLTFSLIIGIFWATQPLFKGSVSKELLSKGKKYEI